VACALGGLTHLLFESPLLGCGGSSSIGESNMTGETGGGGSMKFPRRSWARSNASTLRRNSSSPAQARSRKALRSTTGCWRASVKMATARVGSSLIRKLVHPQHSLHNSCSHTAIHFINRLGFPPHSARIQIKKANSTFFFAPCECRSISICAAAFQRGIRKALKFHVSPTFRNSMAFFF
jgi:hypothetical protein